MNETTIRIECPECSARLGFAAERAGHKASCSQCSAVLQLPGEPVPEGDVSGKALGYLGLGIVLLVASIAASSSGQGVFYGMGAVGLGLTLSGGISLATGMDPAQINRFGR